MRKLIVFIFNLVFGLAFGAVGVCLAIWVGLALYKVELAFDWVLWAAEYSPLPLNITPMQLASEAIQRNSLIAAGVSAAFLCWFAFDSLRSARQSLRSDDESDDGKARIELKTEHPQVGSPLEGRLRLTKDAKLGELFRVELSCKRRHISGDKKLEETAFCAKQDVQAIQDAHGWNLPFRFDVPVTMPPSAKRDMLAGEGYHWLLAFSPANEWVSFPSLVALTLAPAPAEELRAIEASESPAQKAVIKAIIRLPGLRALLPHQRAEIRALSPEDLAMAQKVAGIPMKILKWMFIVIVVITIVIGVMMFAVATLLTA